MLGGRGYFPVYHTLERTNKNTIHPISAIAHLSRVFHNNAFSSNDVGVLAVGYDYKKCHPDFFSGILEVIFPAAGHLPFCLDFDRKYKGKGRKNRKNHFSPLKIIFKPPI